MAWPLTNQRKLNNAVVGAISTHFSDPATLYVVPIGDTSLIRSNDYGATWTRLKSIDLNGTTVRRTDTPLFDPNQSETMYQVVDGARVLRSEDGGATWAPPPGADTVARGPRTGPAPGERLRGRPRPRRRPRRGRRQPRRGAHLPQRPSSPHAGTARIMSARVRPSR